jgi:chitinase
MRLLLSGLALLSSVHLGAATQAMRRPANYLGPIPSYPMEAHPETINANSSGKINAAYFTNWGIYGANFQPQDIVTNTLTHILYSFADIDPSTGTVRLTDSWADEEQHYEGDSWEETGNNLYGCLKQLYLIKLKHRNIKVLLSVGGWTYSESGHFDFVTSASLRKMFVKSAVQLVKDYAFDGIDIDFEYPSTPEQGKGFADLLTEMRTGLKNLASSNNDTVPYQLTIAVAAGAAHYANYVVPQMDKAIDYWNLMAYDYSGSWITWADHQANVYGGERTNVSTDRAITWYLGQGASVNKINMGIPLYGRAFEKTDGIGKPYEGVGPGTEEAGIYSYNFLPLAGSKIYQNETDITSYSYDSSKKEVVSYDTPDIVKLKAKYAAAKGLAGTMFWELSTDKKGDESLVGITAQAFGGLDKTQNHINFPNSKWDNVRNKMGKDIHSTSTHKYLPSPTSTGGIRKEPALVVYEQSTDGLGFWGRLEAMVLAGVTAGVFN